MFEIFKPPFLVFFSPGWYLPHLVISANFSMPGRATTKRWRCCWGQTWRWMQWTRQDRIKNWSMVVCDPTEIGPVAVNLSWIILAFVPFTWGLPHEIGTGIFLRRRSVLLRSIMRWMAEWNQCMWHLLQAKGDMKLQHGIAWRHGMLKWTQFIFGECYLLRVFRVFMYLLYSLSKAMVRYTYTS